MVPHDGASSVDSPAEEGCRDAMSSTSHNHYYPAYEALHICRLVGHEGSIFRIAWSSDGSKLVSVSDDRRLIVSEFHLNHQFLNVFPNVEEL